jgi:hypothetical protein
MSDTEYTFKNPQGETITTRSEAAAAHMRFDLGFEESKPHAARGKEPVAETDPATGTTK